MQTQLTCSDVTPRQLDRFAKLIYQRIGVTISPQKVTLLSNRLRRRLRQNNLACYDKYYELLSKSPAAGPEWEEFLQEVTTHETYLFRDQLHWDWLRDTFVPETIAKVRSGARPQQVRIWSAACSTGDEATTAACCLADRLPSLHNWKVEIVGTDVGAATVRKAREMAFCERSMRLVPESYQRRFFSPALRGPGQIAKPVIRDMMHFEIHNLLEPLREAPFDLIILKNVLIYFDAESKQKVIGNIRRALRPGGSIITGPAEGVSEYLKEFQSSFGWLHRAI